nr:retrovirus-related Pol polyprotein from transposon TNT 1-94 [Tanacetum cinerariifolium]
MPNLEDITDSTTTMNMALALMAKAFKLNYSTPTNNNQRISSNPRNRQIAQSSMNMGQDRQMQMVGGNGGNQFRQYAGQNAGNHNGLIGVQGNGNLVVARAEGNAARQNGNQIRCYNCRGVATSDLDEIKEVNANCILMANLQQASTSGTQTDSAPVYDSDGSATRNNEIFNMFTQEEQYTELLEPIPESHQASHIRLFIKGKKHGMMMLDSIDNGPLVYPTVEEDRYTRLKKYSELTKAQQLQDDCDVQATNINLHGLPPDVYALVNHQETAKDIWDKIKLLMKCTELSYQKRECRLYNLFDKFASVQGETLYEYYWIFSQLINDMHTIGMTMQPFKMEESQFNKFKEDKLRVLLTVPQNSAFQTEDLDAYDSDCDDISSAKAVLMANLSSCDSDVLFEVPYSDTYLNDIKHDVQEMSYSKQIHDTNSSTPNDLLVLSLVEQMTDQVANSDKENQTNKMVNESLIAGLERYKERVAIFKQRENVDFNKREELIDSQMDDLIRNRNTKLVDFPREIDTLKKLKGKNVVDTAVSTPIATTIAPGMFKLDVEPISHRLTNNRDVHDNYLKKTIENTDTIRGLVEYARKHNPSKPLLDSDTTACYTQNRSLIRKRYNKTPYELLHDRKHDLSYLHVFGSLCYPTNDGEDLGLVQNIPSPASYVPPTKNDWETLFQLMFDEYLNPLPCVDLEVPIVIALELAVSTGSPSSTIIDQDAPSTSTSQTTQETPSLVIPLDIKEADHDIKVAHMDNNSTFDISIPEPSSKESSS